MGWIDCPALRGLRCEPWLVSESQREQNGALYQSRRLRVLENCLTLPTLSETRYYANYVPSLAMVWPRCAVLTGTEGLFPTVSSRLSFSPEQTQGRAVQPTSDYSNQGLGRRLLFLS